MGKLTDRTTLANPALDDKFHVVDISDTTDDPAGTSKQVVLSAIGALFVANTTVVANVKTDLPAPSGGKIPLVANTNYIDGDNFSIGTDQLDFSAGNISWSSGNIFGPAVTYTGTGAACIGTDVGTVSIFNTRFEAPNGSVYAFDDTVSGTSQAFIAFVQIDNCVSEGVFTDLFSLSYTNNVTLDADDGVTVSGTDWGAQVYAANTVVSTSASFVGIDLGTSVSTVIGIGPVTMSAPGGAVGVSGASGSGNIPVGNIGTFRDSTFTGGMTDIAGLSVDDIRWAFRDNSPTADTMPDAMAVLSNNATATVSTGGDPTAILGTFVDQESSHFTISAAGLITYIGEKTLKGPIDLTVGAKSASGSNKDIEIYIAFNGAEIAATKKEGRVSSNSRESITAFWQRGLNTGDTLQAFGANVTDDVGIVFVDAILRVL